MHFSDTSFQAVGRFRLERKVFEAFDMPEKELTAELKPTSDREETCTIAMGLLGLLEKGL